MIQPKREKKILTNTKKFRKRWREVAVREWNGRDENFIVRLNPKYAIVKFLELEGEAMCVELEKEGGNWYFKRIVSPNADDWQDSLIEE